MSFFRSIITSLVVIHIIESSIRLREVHFLIYILLLHIGYFISFLLLHFVRGIKFNYFISIEGRDSAAAQTVN